MANTRRAASARLNGAADTEDERRDAAEALRGADRKFKESGGSLLHESLRPVEIPEDPTEFLKPVETELFSRGDGLPLLYRGKTHTVISETEAGKTWLGLLVSEQEILAGNDANFIDFEDTDRGIIGRLALRVPWPLIRKHFHYIRPTVPISGTAFAESLTGTFTFLDGVTEAMNLQGCADMDGSGVAEFNRIWTTPIADRGQATLQGDHVKKDPKSRDRSAIGSVHKINAVTGTSFILVNKEPFGRGQRGHSELIVAKDRPGFLRQHGIPKTPPLVHIADLVIDATGDELELSLTPPGGDAFQPTRLMGRLSRKAKELDDELSKAAMKENGRVSDKDREFSKTRLARTVDGQKQYKFRAVDELVAGGYLHCRKETRGEREFKHLKFIKVFSTQELGEEELDPSI